MEEAPENGKESSHSVHANGLIDKQNISHIHLLIYDIAGNII